MALFDASVFQLSGTEAWKTPPPLMGRYCEDGGGTGCPGVPVVSPGAPVSPDPPPDGLFAFARSPIDFAGGSAANALFIGWNSLASAAVAIVSDAASWLMYCDRFPGFGWLLSHCGLPPFPASFSIVSNMCASDRGS